MINEKDLYFVAVKIFILNNKGELLITKDKFGDWDIPGGRGTEDDFFMTMIIIFSMGLITGILSGLFGVGGGIILIPMLVLLLGVTQHSAQGISMLMMIPTAIVGIYHFHKDKLVNYHMATYMATGAVVGALISANFVQYIPADILKKIFGVFIIYAGAKMIWTKPQK